MNVREDERADADLNSVTDRHPVWIRVLNNDIAADTNVGTDRYSSPSMKRDS
jgi:hypothetical protein